MSIKTTPWFGPDQKPVHVGPYECEWTYNGGTTVHSYKNFWNGTKFMSGYNTAHECLHAKEPPTRGWKLIRWRGVLRSA